MAKLYEEIDERWREWIAAQPMFFVATAPLAADGHVNVSPKGPRGTLQVLGPREVAYVDMAGSGAETIAHLRENGRIVVMFCSFEGPPRILRLHGRGEVIDSADPRFAELLGRAPFEQSSVPELQRSLIHVEVSRVSDSCGYGVPLMSYEGDRDHLELSAAKRVRTMGSDAYLEFRRERNSRSIDGLPAVEPAPGLADDQGDGDEVDQDRKQVLDHRGQRT